MERSDTFAEAQACVRELAARAFARHVVVEKGPEEWRCATPGTGNHSFNVICRPGVVLIWGDVGEWILRHSDRDSVEWLRTVPSDDYLLGKLVRPDRQFYKDDALDYVRERLAEDPGSQQWAAVLADERHIADQSSWAAVVMEHTGDAEYVGIGTNYSGGGLWIAEALRWLSERLR